jgi:hypothetical protein
MGRPKKVKRFYVRRDRVHVTPSSAPATGVSARESYGCSVVIGRGVHHMITCILPIASIAIVIAAALLGRRFIAIEDAEESVMTEGSDDRGWVPSRADELLLEDARRELVAQPQG